MPPAVAAVAIGSAISGGAALGAAKLQSNAAKNAAKEQQKGTDRALQVQREVNQPYLNLGQQGASALSSGQAMAQPYAQQFRPGSGNTGFQPFQPPQGPPPTLGSIGMPQQPPMPPQGGQPPAMGNMVKLQGPDGSVRDVPAQLAEQFIARGARRVG